MTESTGSTAWGPSAMAGFAGFGLVSNSALGCLSAQYHAAAMTDILRVHTQA